MSIYYLFLPLITFIKPYLYTICRKGVKSTSRLIRYFNACKSYFYSKPLHKPLQHKSHNKKDALSENWKNKGDLLGKTVIIAITNSIFEMSTEDMP